MPTGRLDPLPSFPLTELISPELALVDPELAARARRLPATPFPGLDQAPEAPLAPRPEPWGRARRHNVRSRTSSPAPRGSVRQRVGQIRAIVAAGATAGALLAGLVPAFWLSGQPAVSRGSGTEVPRQSLAAPFGGGYASGGVLSFEVGASTGTVASMSVKMACAGRTLLPAMELGPDRTFTFHGRMRGSRGPATVDLVGSFTSRSAALIVVRERGPGCGDSTRRLIARLS